MTLGPDSRLGEHPVVECRAARQALRRGAGGRRRRPRGRGGRDPGAPRSERVRQDHHAATDRRVRAARRWVRSRSTGCPWRAAARSFPPSAGGSVWSSRSTRCSRTSTSRTTSGTACATAPSAPVGSARCSSWWASTASGSACRTSSPGASSNGWRWRVRSRRDPSIVLLDEPFSNLDAALRAAGARRGARHPARRECDGDRRHARPGGGAESRRPGGGDARRSCAAGRHARSRSTRDPAELFVATFVGDAVVLDGTTSTNGDARHAPARAARCSASSTSPTPARRRVSTSSCGPSGCTSRRERGATVGRTARPGDLVLRSRPDRGGRARRRERGARAPRPAGARFAPGDRVAVDVVGRVLAFPTSRRARVTAR